MRHIIFGESHGPAIGVVLEGVPAGIPLDLDFVQSELARRAPGQNALSTARKEADQVRILSGVFQGKTTGTPLCAVIENTDTRSRDYEKTKDLMRPAHADYTCRVRYGGWADYRGGGHFSGRGRPHPGDRRNCGPAHGRRAGRDRPHGPPGGAGEALPGL